MRVSKATPVWHISSQTSTRVCRNVVVPNTGFGFGTRNSALTLAELDGYIADIESWDHAPGRWSGGVATTADSAVKYSLQQHGNYSPFSICMRKLGAPPFDTKAVQSCYESYDSYCFATAIGTDR